MLMVVAAATRVILPSASPSVLQVPAVSKGSPCNGGKMPPRPLALRSVSRRSRTTASSLGRRIQQVRSVLRCPLDPRHASHRLCWLLSNEDDHQDDDQQWGHD